MNYRVIYADPPWRFATYSAKGRSRCPDGDVGAYHYETMSVADIKAMPIAEMADPSRSFLFIWVYQPLLPEAIDVMRSWGFRYVTIGFIWAKTGRAFGTGYYTRSGGEICLLGRRGNGKAGVLAHDVPQLIEAPRRENSRKPDEAYERIERLLDGPYLELFARSRRSGWDVAFSDQADRFGAAA